MSPAPSFEPIAAAFGSSGLTVDVETDERPTGSDGSVRRLEP